MSNPEDLPVRELHERWLQSKVSPAEDKKRGG
jgi:hypothetical protein